MDSVNYVIETMLPTLEQFFILGIISREELNDIVHKRRAFEMKIGGATKEKLDFIQYIQYEISLTRLVQLRAKQMSMHTLPPSLYTFTF